MSPIYGRVVWFSSFSRCPLRVPFLSRNEPVVWNLFTFCIWKLFSGLEHAHQENFLRIYDDATCMIGTQHTSTQRTETRNVALVSPLQLKTDMTPAYITLRQTGCRRLDEWDNSHTLKQCTGSARLYGLHRLRIMYVIYNWLTSCVCLLLTEDAVWSVNMALTVWRHRVVRTFIPNRFSTSRLHCYRLHESKLCPCTFQLLGQTYSKRSRPHAGTDTCSVTW